jgi:hypothetical protein
MEHEYKKFNKLTTFCRKNTAVQDTTGRQGLGRVLESYSLYPEPIFYSLKLKDYEEDHFGTLSPVRYCLDVRFGTRDG